MVMHGGDIEGYRQEFGAKPLDFSANVNPLGLPDGVRKAIERALPTADAYPDPLCRELTAALAAHRGIDSSHLLFGNGAADVIFRIVLAECPRRALLPAPTFTEYEQALRLVDCQIDHYRLAAPGFDVEEGLLAALSDRHDILFLCNPNNPTGKLIAPDLMARLVKRCAQLRIRLVVDECFMGFVRHPQRHGIVPMLATNAHLLIVDAYTKLYGMAGIRLGYAMSADRDLLLRMRGAGQPWAVSSIAQAAGIAALREEEYVRSSLAMIDEEKAFLLSELRARGLRPIGHAASYIFFYSDNAHLDGELRQRGLLIRSCANYRGLDARHYRIAVRTHDENIQLIQALDTIGGNR